MDVHMDMDIRRRADMDIASGPDMDIGPRDTDIRPDSGAQTARRGRFPDTQSYDWWCRVSKCRQFSGVESGSRFGAVCHRPGLALKREPRDGLTGLSLGSPE